MVVAEQKRCTRVHLFTVKKIGQSSSSSASTSDRLKTHFIHSRSALNFSQCCYICSPSTLQDGSEDCGQEFSNVSSPSSWIFEIDMSCNRQRTANNDTMIRLQVPVGQIPRDLSAMTKPASTPLSIFYHITSTVTSTCPIQTQTL